MVPINELFQFNVFSLINILCGNVNCFRQKKRPGVLQSKHIFVVLKQTRWKSLRWFVCWWMDERGIQKKLSFFLLMFFLRLIQKYELFVFSKFDKYFVKRGNRIQRQIILGLCNSTLYTFLFIIAGSRLVKCVVQIVLSFCCIYKNSQVKTGTIITLISILFIFFSCEGSSWCE